VPVSMLCESVNIRNINFKNNPKSVSQSDFLLGFTLTIVAVPPKSQLVAAGFF
jgi:hypothetical protein